jgi:hypothetical protein
LAVKSPRGRGGQAPPVVALGDGDPPQRGAAATPNQRAFEPSACWTHAGGARRVGARATRVPDRAAFRIDRQQDEEIAPRPLRRPRGEAAKDACETRLIPRRCRGCLLEPRAPRLAANVRRHAPSFAADPETS